MIMMQRGRTSPACRIIVNSGKWPGEPHHRLATILHCTTPETGRAEQHLALSRCKMAHLSSASLPSVRANPDVAHTRLAGQRVVAVRPQLLDNELPRRVHHRGRAAITE